MCILDRKREKRECFVLFSTLPFIFWHHRHQRHVTPSEQYHAPSATRGAKWLPPVVLLLVLPFFWPAVPMEGVAASGVKGEGKREATGEQRKRAPNDVHNVQRSKQASRGKGQKGDQQVEGTCVMEFPPLPRRRTKNNTHETLANQPQPTRVELDFLLLIPFQHSPPSGFKPQRVRPLLLCVCVCVCVATCLSFLPHTPIYKKENVKSPRFSPWLRAHTPSLPPSRGASWRLPFSAQNTHKRLLPPKLGKTLHTQVRGWLQENGLFYLVAAWTMVIKSSVREAPPTRKPSMSVWRMSPAALEPLTEPP